MITNKQLTNMSYEMAYQFEQINVEYIAKIAQHIKDIGQMTATDLHILQQMQIMSSNVAEINAKLSKLCNLTASQLRDVYSESGADVYAGLEKYYKATNTPQLPFYKNMRLQSYLASLSRRTEGTFKNISRTTVISKPYQRAVDKAVYLVSSGVTDYNKAMRDVINDYTRGMRVEYPTLLKNGEHLTRRLDSAVRMNILGGVRQLNQGIYDITGREFGADGVEVSAHLLCAPDHLDIQGRQLSNEEFEDINADLVRPIGELNCHHYTMPIVLGVSGEAVDSDTLQEYKDYSNEMIEIDDRTYTRYEASQAMRNLETKVRYSREARIDAVIRNDANKVALCDRQIEKAQDKYTQIADIAGLEQHRERMRIYGY